MPKRRYKLTNAVERIDEEIHQILSKRQSTRYFEGIALMYSMMENVLKWLVFYKSVWDKCNRVLSEGEIESLRQFCNQLDFHSAQNVALVNGLISHSLFRRIDKIRRERNDLLHQCYLFTHRRNPKVLRAKLKGIVSVADALFRIFNRLVIKSGADDSYDVFMVRRGRQMI